MNLGLGLGIAILQQTVFLWTVADHKARRYPYCPEGDA
jgi:hypothetical protein